ncbi:MAG: phage gp6-like head-tail connector protein, partial [Gammaproteobacteria bacterium]|nr:phage gp6-like head-tail connector protein [Gammaproteobacteria bacterium]
QFAENFTNISILDTESIDKLNDFESEITLKKQNVQSIASITYYDTDGAQQTQADYFLDTREIKAILMPVYDNSWPDTNKNYENVVITYQSGYTSIPEGIDQAGLILIGSMYDQRENHITAVSINSVPLSAEYLLNQYKIHAL